MRRDDHELCIVEFSIHLYFWSAICFIRYTGVRPSTSASYEWHAVIPGPGCSSLIFAETGLHNPVKAHFGLCNLI
jgi:hypothetical protein